MKLYLFGWAELDKNHHVPQLKLIEQIIHEIWPKQVLHIPFARSPETEKDRWDDRFIKDVDLHAIEYLNAKNQSDIDKANNPLVVITWWWNNLYLLESIKNNPKLLSLVLNAEFLIWESAGSMILWEYLRVKPEWKDPELIKWLGILKDTIIEPHYTERNRHQLLEEEIHTIWLSFGIGIDCVTAIVFDSKDFLNKYTTIGNGLVEIKTKKEKIVIVDEHDTILDYKYRWTEHTNDWYRVSALRITNSHWEILLAKRHPSKKHNPNKRWPAVAGTVEYWETYEDNIIKEAEEELWLKDIKLELWPKTKNMKNFFHFVQRYTLCCDKNISEFTIKANEVSEINWFSPQQLEQLLKTNSEDFLPEFNLYYELFKK